MTDDGKGRQKMELRRKEVERSGRVRRRMVVDGTVKGIGSRLRWFTTKTI